MAQKKLEKSTGDRQCPVGSRMRFSLVRTNGRVHPRLVAIAAQLDQDLARLALDFQLPVITLREAFNAEASP